MLCMETRAEGAEAIYSHLELHSYPVVVERRCKDEHIRIEDSLTQRLHTVLLYAGALVATGDTSGTGTDIGIRDIDDLHTVSHRLSTFSEGMGQQCG